MEKLDQLDWQLLHIFLAVAETGSLSAAARKLKLSQPTLGRQVRAAEQALGVSLFKREARGLALTEDGAALVEPAREMAEAVARIGLLTAGGDQDTSGTVRITASVVVSHYLLPPVIARIREAAPGKTHDQPPSPFRASPG